MKHKFLLASLMLFFALSASAQSGTCGENLTWTLSNDILTISGTGAMNGYSSYSNAPWYSYCSSITTVIIEDEVTSIGEWAFYNCSGMTSVTIGESVTSIDYRAFEGCSSLTSVVWNAKSCNDFMSFSTPFYYKN